MNDLNARVGKSHPAAHQGEPLADQEDGDQRLEALIVGVVCVLAIICAALPALMP